jgi:hypothetical protein
VVLFLAYLNLLGNKRVGCYCCCCISFRRGENVMPRLADSQFFGIKFRFQIL